MPEEDLDLLRRIRALEDNIAPLRDGVLFLPTQQIAIATPLPNFAGLYAKNYSARSGAFYVDDGGTEFWLADSVFRTFYPTSTAADWALGFSGTGAASPLRDRLSVDSGGATGAARISEASGILAVTRGSDVSIINWSRRVLFKCRFSVYVGGVNGISRLSLGRQFSDGVGDLDDRGVGIKITTLGLAGQVHNGTSLTTTATLATLVAQQTYDLLIISRGDGTVEWFLDDVSIGTSTGGPTGSGTVGHTNFRMESSSAATAQHRLMVMHWGIADLAA